MSAQRQFRLTFGGGYNTRVSAVNASDTSSGYVGVGIVGLAIVGKTSPSNSKDQRFLNCFIQTVDGMHGRKRYLVKRPGFGTYNTPSSGNSGQAIIVWTGQGNGQKVITAFGGTNSTLYDGTTSLGAITGRCTGLSETFVSTTATILATSTDNTAWYYDTVVGVATKITDADFPGNAGKTLAGTFANMDGYAAIMDTTGAVWASDLNSVTAWTATSYDSANAYPDKGIGLVRNKNMLLAFGSESLQFFYNAGLTPFPFAKAVNLTVKVGCISADAITQISDTTFWCGSTPQGGLSIFKYDGSVNRVSTPEIDAVLILAGTSGITLTSLRNLGRSFVFVQAASQTFVYCVEENFWFEYSSTTPLWYKCAGTSIAGTMVNYAISNVSTSGKVYIQNHASLVYTDDSVAYTARAQLGTEDHGTARRKFYSDLEIIGDIESSSSPVTLLYSDDDYGTWTTHGTTLDLSTSRPRVTRLGSSRKRAWAITHSAATPMRIEALEGNVEIGS